MHYCLRWRVHTVTLEEEVDYIRSYVYLLNIRNDYVISLETEMLSFEKHFSVVMSFISDSQVLPHFTLSNLSSIHRSILYHFIFHNLSVCLYHLSSLLIHKLSFRFHY